MVFLSFVKVFDEPQWLRLRVLGSNGKVLSGSLLKPDHDSCTGDRMSLVLTTTGSMLE